MPDVESLLDKQPIMLFDGKCRFCNGVFRFVAERDRGELHYAPLQSDEGEAILEEFGVDEDSFVYVESGEAYTESGAAVKLLRQLGGIWRLLGVLLGLVPGLLRDLGYRLVASYRKDIMGRREECLVPGEELRERFLDMDH